MYPLDTTPADVWASYDGYLSFTGISADTVDSCVRIDDSFVFSLNDEGAWSTGLQAMHFGISFGELSDFFVEEMPAWYESGFSEDNGGPGSDIGLAYFEENKNGFITQYIHINHQDSSADEGFDFSGYDWNSGRMVNYAADGTLGLIPCSYDESIDCYDMAVDAIPGERNALVLGDAYWYEDFPNIDFDLLALGVPPEAVADSGGEEEEGEGGEGSCGEGSCGEGSCGDGDGDGE